MRRVVEQWATSRGVREHVLHYVESMRYDETALRLRSKEAFVKLTQEPQTEHSSVCVLGWGPCSQKPRLDGLCGDQAHLTNFPVLRFCYARRFAGRFHVFVWGSTHPR